MIDSQNILIEDNKTNDLEFLISRAEMAEENRKFSIASNHYFTLLSRHLNSLSKKPELLKNITESFIFTILLLPVGLQRERMLNFILKNENLNIFNHKSFLEKLYRYQLIKDEELSKFLTLCPPKFLSFVSIENNIFEKSVFEHNLISLSKIYENINFTTLEKYLRLDIEKILNFTFKMILEKKLNAKIDEINKFIFFLPEPTTSLNFDKQIQNFCLKVVQLNEYIKKKNI